MAGFVQIIELQTSRIDEVDTLIESRRSGGPPKFHNLDIRRVEHR
jgi:hypothetical protein